MSIAPIEQILEKLAPRGSPLDADALRGVGLAEGAVAMLIRIGAQEISGDFRIPDVDGMIANNTAVPFLPAGWVSFAESGSGDLWVLPRGGADDVAFVDHDRESAATAEPLGIRLEQWVQLAWFMHEGADERRAARKDPEARKRRSERARAFLEALSAGLPTRTPFGCGARSPCGPLPS